MPDKTILLLGGAGLVGAQVAWQISCDVSPEKVIIAALYQREVRETIELLEREFPNVKYIGVWGDVFVRADFTGERRATLLSSAKRRADLFEDLLGNLDQTYARSRLVQLIREHKPDVIVDSINTATAISYQDVYSASIIAKQKMDALFARIESLEQMVRTPTPTLPSLVGGRSSSANGGGEGVGVLTELQNGVGELAKMRKGAQRAFDALVLSQSVRNLIRHVILVLRAL